MKKLKRLLKILVIIVIISIVNGIFYLYSYQYKTVNKINKNVPISLYEKASILTLHAGLYTVGSLYCADAGYANFRMLTKQDTLLIHNNKWLSPKIRQRFKDNELGKMAWNGNKDYAINSKEKNAAILLNYCYLKTRIINGKICYVAECPYTWKQPSKTEFNLGFVKIIVFEQLFYELEKEGILHPYTLVCYYEKETE